jgi:hypothetical protein
MLSLWFGRLNLYFVVECSGRFTMTMNHVRGAGERETGCLVSCRHNLLFVYSIVVIRKGSELPRCVVPVPHRSLGESFGGVERCPIAPSIDASPLTGLFFGTTCLSLTVSTVSPQLINQGIEIDGVSAEYHNSVTPGTLEFAAARACSGSEKISPEPKIVWRTQ